MATLTVVDAVPAGVDIAGAAVAASDKFANTGKEILIIKNGSGAPINVTVTTPMTVGAEGLSVTDLVVAVAAGATKEIGPFEPGIYNDDNDFVTFVCSDLTTVTAKVLKVTPR